jgi:hypothetical protein
MNRAARRRAKSKKRGATQMNHQTYGLKLHAEQIEKQHNEKIYKREEE